MKKGIKHLAIFGVIFFSFTMLATPFFRVYAATELENVGFVPANIWYSKDSPAEGETIRIYTFLFNNSMGTLTGTAGFYEGSTLLGQKTFSLPSQTSKDIYINWKTTPGDHVIHAQIGGAKVSYADGKSENVSLANSKTSDSEIFVSKSITVASSSDDMSNVDTSKNNPADGTGTGLATSISLDSALNILPANIKEPLAESFDVLDDWREKKADSFEDMKIEAKKNIDELKGTDTRPITLESVKNALPTFGATKASVATGSDAAEKKAPLKPFEYAKLFFATIASFIFAHKILFYVLLFALTFGILKFFWGKVL